MSVLGRRGHEEHKNKASGGKLAYGIVDPDLLSMIGEIYPNIMFYQTKVKWTQTTQDGCEEVRMNTIECICSCICTGE